MRRMLVAAATALVVLLGVGTAGVVLAHTDDGDGLGGHPMSTGRWMDGPMSIPVGEAGELDFLREMIAHHREAIDAAGELERSQTPAMQDFGRDIVADQSAQVRLMEGWLVEWYPDEETDAPYQPMMRDLTGLSGDRLDEAFLEDMIGHHMGAVMMSQQLLMHGADTHIEVADLAAKIRDDQMREIRWMRSRLTTRPGGRAWSRMHG